jgi:D-inositol-3-phosphate glycosyltransferase
VADGRSGVLVDGHRTGDWAAALGSLLDDAPRRAELAAGARHHAAHFSWDRTAEGLLLAYQEAGAALADLALAQ